MWRGGLRCTWVSEGLYPGRHLVYVTGLERILAL